MSANLYDLLDVDETATAAEIRAAWKTAIADLDPTDRRFRAYNDAAGVLLDEDKRASYDAGLASERAEAEAEAAEVDVAAGPEADREAEAEADETESDEPDATAMTATTTAAATTTVAAGDAGVAPVRSDVPAEPSPGPGKGTLIGVAVAAVLAVLLAIWVLTLSGVRADDSPKDVAERSASQDKATITAETAAEQMVAPVLSYNHKTMAEDLERLRGFLTDRMAGKQIAAWPELTKEAEAQEIVVEASATGTALTRVDPDGKRATVVVFIDQDVEKKGASPFVLRMWATMSLVREGDGDRWLLDDLCTDDSCG